MKRVVGLTNNTRVDYIKLHMYYLSTEDHTLLIRTQPMTNVDNVYGISKIAILRYVKGR